MLTGRRSPDRGGDVTQETGGISIGAVQCDPGDVHRHPLVVGAPLCDKVRLAGTGRCRDDDDTAPNPEIQRRVQPRSQHCSWRDVRRAQLAGEKAALSPRAVVVHAPDRPG